VKPWKKLITDQKIFNIYNKTHKMTQEQLRMQMLAGVITEGEYKAILNEELSKDQIVQALKNLIDAGELTGAEVRVMMDGLKVYHRGWVNRQRSPEQRKASALKASATKAQNAKEYAAKEQAQKILGIEDTDYATQFALNIGLHRDKGLQKRFDDEVEKILNK
jgi:cephalosporin hydroxylase